MVFHRSRIKHNQTAIKIQICTINKTDSIKFIGVIIDNKLNWHEHIIYIINKISKSIGIIYKVRKYVEKQTIKICVTHLYSHISSTAMKYGAMLVRHM